ncbi:hypothetical protein O1L55_14385 [Streptomyces albulus]|nr:hypothetical protein [Streptomyces noursei]
MSGEHGIDPVTALRAGKILEATREPRQGLAETDEAIAALDAVLTATPPGALRITILSNLGLIRMVRFQLTAAPADLDAAIDCFRDAQAAHTSHLPEGSHPGLSAVVPNLIGALHARAELTGHWDDLDEAILLGREAAVHIPPGLPQRRGARQPQQRPAHPLRTRRLRRRLDGGHRPGPAGQRGPARRPPATGPGTVQPRQFARRGGAVDGRRPRLRAGGRTVRGGGRPPRPGPYAHQPRRGAGPVRPDRGALTASWAALEEFRALGDASDEARVKKNVASFLTGWAESTEWAAPPRNRAGYARILADCARILGRTTPPPAASRTGSPRCRTTRPPPAGRRDVTRRGPSP